METKGIIARKKTFKEKLFEKFFPEEFRRLEEAEKKIETLNYEVQDEELYTGFSTKEESKRLEEMQSINQGAIAFIAMQNLK